MRLFLYDERRAATVLLTADISFRYRSPPCALRSAGRFRYARKTATLEEGLPPPLSVEGSPQAQVEADSTCAVPGAPPRSVFPASAVDECP